MNTRSLARPVRDYIQQLRRERKAALRECGHLGEKLHTTRLVIELQRHRIKDLESQIKDADSARYEPYEKP